MDDNFLKRIVALRHLDERKHFSYLVEKKHVHETIPCFLDDKDASYYCFNELHEKSKRFNSIEDLVREVCKAPQVVVDPLMPGEDIMSYLQRYMIRWTDVTAYKILVSWEPVFMALTEEECSEFLAENKSDLYRIQPFYNVSDGFLAFLSCAEEYAEFMLQQDHRKMTVRQITRYYEPDELLQEFKDIPNTWLQVGIVEFLAPKEMDGMSDDPCRKITVWAKSSSLPVYDTSSSVHYSDEMRMDIKVTLSYNGGVPKSFLYPWKAGMGLPELLTPGTDDNWLWLYDCLRLCDDETVCQKIS